MLDTYNPNSIGTPCCPFSGGVEEYAYQGGIGLVSYRCTECKGCGKEKGWFSVGAKISGVGQRVSALIVNN